MDMKKKVLALMLSTTMVATLIPGWTLPAFAEVVFKNDDDENQQTNSAVSGVEVQSSAVALVAGKSVDLVVTSSVSLEEGESIAEGSALEAKSDDEGIATASISGFNLGTGENASKYTSTLTINAIAKGTTSIKVTATDDVYASVAVTVITELEKAKEDAKAELESYKAQDIEALNASEEKTAVETEKTTGASSIDDATDIEGVSKALADAKASVDEKIELATAAQQLAEAKTKASAELSGYKDAADYEDEVAAKITEEKTKGETAIGNATTVEAVADELQKAKGSIDTIIQEAMETLATEKTTAKAELENYKEESDYSTEKWEDVQAEIATGKENIDKATKKADIKSASDDAKAAIDAIETLAQELAAEKEAAKADIDKYMSTEISGLDAGTAATEISELKNTKKSLIDGADDIEKVREILAEAKTEIKAKVDAAVEAELEAEKTKQKAEFGEYIDTHKSSITTNEAINEALDSAKESGNDIIDSATIKGDVATKLADAKALVDNIIADARAANAVDTKIGDIAAKALTYETAKDGSDADATADAKTAYLNAVNTARSSYTALTENQKSYVANLADLTEAEDAIAGDADLSDSYDEQRAKEVTDAITALTAEESIAIGDKASIESARALYDALNDSQKEKVTNYDKLQKAESALAVAVAADAVDKLITALPNAGAITLSDKDAVSAARAAYEALTDEQKAKVTKVSVLTEAEKKLTELQEAEDTSAANSVIGLITALPAGKALALSDKDSVNAAKAAYEALGANAKAKVDADNSGETIAKLNAAVSWIAELEEAANNNNQNQSQSNNQNQNQQQDNTSSSNTSSNNSNNNSSNSSGSSSNTNTGSGSSTTTTTPTTGGGSKETTTTTNPDGSKSVSEVTKDKDGNTTEKTRETEKSKTTTGSDGSRTTETDTTKTVDTVDPSTGKTTERTKTETTTTEKKDKDGNTTEKTTVETTTESTFDKDGAEEVTKTTTVEKTQKADGSSTEKKTTETSDGTTKTETTEVAANGSRTQTSTTTKENGQSTSSTIKTNKSGKATSLTTTEKQGSRTTESETYAFKSGSNISVKSGKTTKSKFTVPSKVKAPNGRTYTVTGIEKNAYKGQKSMKSVSIPASITSIGEGAFKGATGMKSATIGSGSNVKTSGLFAGILATKTSVKIGKNAFNGAKNLKTVTIKGNVGSVGKGAFKGINKKATIKVSGVTKKQFKKIGKMIKKSGIGKKVKVKKTK